MDGALASLERLRALESRGDLMTRILLPFTIEADTLEERLMTVMAEDPVDVDGDELVSLPVLLTVVDGEVVFRGL